ncbi:MCT7 [Symbiodinium pilosum]|uniref:MCT7 protein n=1 Tax=Symbiodinium pilosum TaxID=2952 RepID=A0A812XYV8_SYMPI|nr:MCT7 [Symbiodinium pilosum]
MLLRFCAVLGIYAPGCSSEDRIYGNNGSHREVDWNLYSTSYPFLVSLVFEAPDDHQVCSGTLIHENYVLTAASCWYPESQNNNFEESSLVKRLSVWLHTPSGWRVARPQYLHTHRNFSRESYRDNIAIFHLMTPLVGVPVATLEQQQVEHVGEQALVAGWGAADSECKVRPKPSVLKEGDKQIASSRPCYLQTLLGRGKGPFEPGRHICTQEIQSGSAGMGCGDEGAPMLLRVNGTTVQVGLYSHKSGLRDIFVRVSAYADWINSVLTYQNFCRPPDCWGGWGGR